MKITVLAENTANEMNLPCEHGLSLYIETDSQKILFDMGQTSLFSENAKALGIDLTKVDIAVLSHGHYDHTGGLETFLSENSHAPVYINRHAFGEHFNGKDKYIGINKAFEGNRRLVITDDCCTINENMQLFTCNNKKKKYEMSPCGLNIKTDKGFLPDPFLHEQYLKINENEKTVLISGCSHKGILNIAEWFSPDILVGGFHFSKLPSDNILKSYAEILNSYPTEFYTCHCTGKEQFDFMSKFMIKLKYISTADTVVI